MADEQHPSTAQDSQGNWDAVQPVYIVGMSSDVSLGGGGGGGGTPRQFARVAFQRDQAVQVAVLESTSVVLDIGGLTADNKIALPDGTAWARCEMSAQIFMDGESDALAHTVVMRVFEADVPTLDGAHTAIVLNATVVYVHGATVSFRGAPFEPNPGMNYYAFFASGVPVFVSPVAVEIEVLA